MYKIIAIKLASLSLLDFSHVAICQKRSDYWLVCLAMCTMRWMVTICFCIYTITLLHRNKQTV